LKKIFQVHRQKFQKRISFLKTINNNHLQNEYVAD
jgi:hypothetical protein